MALRFAPRPFMLANELYAGATVTYYTVDVNGAKTSTKATLYDAPAGSGTLTNPQTLDADGKLAQAVYVAEAVIITVSGLAVADHDTGMIAAPWNFREDWATATVYAINDVVTDAANGANTGNLYVCNTRHTSGTWSTDLNTNAYWDLFLDVATAQNWATKTDGAVAGSEYSAKAYAIGGTGVTDTAGKGAAKEWATAAEDDTVDGSEYSAKHYSAKASGFATAAGVSATNAASSASAAAASAAGIYWKEPVVAATTANITLSGTQTIDGISIVADDRVLVKDQTAPAENGIYVCAAGAWSRATPLDTWDEHIGAAAIVSQGSTNADSGWICTVDAGGTLETTAVTWAQMTAVVTTATTTSEGKVELATDAEVAAGTDTARASTPASIAAHYSTITRSRNADTTTSLTLALTDEGDVVSLSNASAVAVTIPTNASVAFDTNTQIDIVNLGAGTVTVSGDTGVTVNGVSAGSFTLAQFKGATILKTASNTWVAPNQTVA